MGFGNTVVIFSDFIEFLRRVRVAAERGGFRVAHQLVKYVDRTTYTGPMGLFKKFSTKSAEQEFRIALAADVSGPLSLNVGPLTDITVTSTADGIFKLDRKRQSSH